jgi:hypothetical protein
MSIVNRFGCRLNGFKKGSVSGSLVALMFSKVVQYPFTVCSIPLWWQQIPLIITLYSSVIFQEHTIYEMLLFEHRTESPCNCSNKDTKETAVIVLMSGFIRLTAGLTVMGACAVQ